MNKLPGIVATLTFRVIALYLFYKVLYPIMGNDILWFVLALILWKAEITTE